MRTFLCLATVLFLGVGTLGGDSPSTQPATAHDYVDLLNKMPTHLQPKENEDPSQVYARNQWLAKAPASRPVYWFTGKLVSVLAKTVVKDAKPVDVITIELQCGTYTVWGQELRLIVHATLRDIPPETTRKWNRETTLTLVAPNKASVELSGRQPAVDVRLESATLK